MADYEEALTHHACLPCCLLSMCPRNGQGRAQTMFLSLSGQRVTTKKEKYSKFRKAGLENFRTHVITKARNSARIKASRDGLETSGKSRLKRQHRIKLELTMT